MHLPGLAAKLPFQKQYSNLIYESCVAQYAELELHCSLTVLKNSINSTI